MKTTPIFLAFSEQSRHRKALSAPSEPSAPRTRGDCIAGERPCPWRECRHHLTVKPSPPVEGEAPTVPPSCVLDVVDERGALTCEDIAPLIGYTRQRVQQIEAEAIRKLARVGVRLR